MHERNLYKIKKYCSRIHNYSEERWRSTAKHVMYTAVHAKFLQNPALLGILLNSGEMLLAEGSPDPYWGIGVHIHDRVALDKRFWKNSGGVTSEIYTRVHQELSKEDCAPAP